MYIYFSYPLLIIIITIRFISKPTHNTNVFRKDINYKININIYNQ